LNEKLFKQWTANWKRMEAIARRRQWELIPLEITAPASEAELLDIEHRHGLQIPLQLRSVLSQHSSRVAFGWSIPSHLQPMEQLGLPTMSANRRSSL
jgi:cell wall assembly regulator SMI1